MEGLLVSSAGLLLNCGLGHSIKGIQDWCHCYLPPAQPEDACDRKGRPDKHGIGCPPMFYVWQTMQLSVGGRELK